MHDHADMGDSAAVAAELRPMSIGDIFDATFKLYVKRFVPFMIIGLIVYLPFAAAVGLVFALATQTGGPDEAAVVAAMLGALVFMLVMIFVMPLCQGAMIHNISAAFLGENQTAVASYGRALPKLLRVIGAGLLYGLIIMLGFFALIVPAIIFGVWFMLTIPVVMLENHGVIDSLKRSKQLMSGNLGKGFLVLLAGGLLAGLCSGAVQVVIEMTLTTEGFLGNFLTQLTPVLFLPIQLAPSILLYYDLRIRKEGFDMEMLAMSLESASPESPRVVGER